MLGENDACMQHRALGHEYHDGSGLPLRWHSSYSVGNALLDCQHIVLMELSCTLHDSALSDEATRATTADLLDIAERHCAAEDHLLTCNGYEWTEQHREEHAVGLGRLRALAAEASIGAISRAQLAGAVCRWIYAHLMDMDLPAREYLHPPVQHDLISPRDPLDPR